MAIKITEQEDAGIGQLTQKFHALMDGYRTMKEVTRAFETMTLNDLQRNNIIEWGELCDLGKSIGHPGAREKNCASHVAESPLYNVVKLWQEEIGKTYTAQDKHDRFWDKMEQVKEDLISLGTKLLAPEYTTEYEEMVGYHTHFQIPVVPFEVWVRDWFTGNSAMLSDKKSKRLFVAEHVDKDQTRTWAWNIKKHRQAFLEEMQLAHGEVLVGRKKQGRFAAIANELLEFGSTVFTKTVGLYGAVWSKVLGTDVLNVATALSPAVFEAISLVKASVIAASAGAEEYATVYIQKRVKEGESDEKASEQADKASRKKVRETAKHEYEKVDRLMNEKFNHLEKMIAAANKAIDFWKDLLKYGLIGLGVLGGVAVTGITIYAVSSGKRVKRAAHALT